MAEQRGQYRRCLDFNASELDSNNVNEDIPSAPFPVIGDANGKALRACTSLKYTNGGAYSNPMNKEHAVSASSRPSKSAHGFNNSSPTRHQNPQPRRSPRKSPRILSGIGLHLNSLSGRVGTLASTKRVTCFPQSLNSNDKSATIVLDSAQRAGRGVFVSVVEKTKTDCQEVQGTGSNHFGLFQSTTRYQSVTVGIQPVEESEPGKRVHLIGKKRLLDSEEEDSGTIQYSPKKRRKPLTTAGSTDGRCKRCNCKKSKCLKLYCECFAAGVYCMDSCMCHDCNNKPEYKAAILGVRQQIESRNPLAFAPKIVHTEDHTPEMDESIDTSSSARHKHGCNCKKSLCLKKYCECYQAGVGCSDGCRCNGCKNVFGRKGGSEPQKIEKDVEAHSEDVFESYSSMKTTGSGSTNFFTDLNSKGHKQTTVFKVSNAVDVMVSKNVSPSTPSTGYSMRLRSSDKRIPIDGGSKSAVSSHLYIDGLADSQANDDNRCIDESESIFEKLPPISPLMSFSCQTSLHVTDTPMTPTCILKRSNPLDACSVHKLAPSIEDEETPDFLRDTDEVQSPPRVLMANSPKQKRVTPPNFDVMNYTGGRITGLRNGKKLSLRALPSLPPIMPSASSMHARMALEQRMDELRRCLAGDVDNIN